MVRSGEQNHRDLLAIVREINQNFAGKGVSFVYLPGDIADHGDAAAYRVVRDCLDELLIPWCGIVGDHDVHEQSFTNFQNAIDPSLFSTFTVGDVLFFRLNAFSEPRPDSFVVSDEQLDWMERELRQSTAPRTVVLMHCYPSDLKRGSERLSALLRQYEVWLVDMGHTHYNELSNDGQTIFSATRSTGQIEEGPVGYSVISLDEDALSWHFVKLGTRMLASITSPTDERLRVEAKHAPMIAGQPVTIRVKVWGAEQPEAGTIECNGSGMELKQSGDALWSATIPAQLLPEGVHEVKAVLKGPGVYVEDHIRLAIGEHALTHRKRSPIDQENALGAWIERDVLGTQLGPNKNGKKW